MMLDSRVIGKTIESITRICIRRNAFGEVDYRKVTFTDGSSVIVKVSSEPGGGGVFTPSGTPEV